MATERGKARVRAAFDLLDHDNPRRITLTGRFAWALGQLIDAGPAGITSLENPAPRLSHYIHILRRTYGLAIETQDERHDGPFAGRHGRYRLLSKVRRADDASVREAA